MPAVAPMPRASETMATAVTNGVLKSVRKANLRLHIRALDEPRYCSVYRLERNARPRYERLQPEKAGAKYPNESVPLAMAIRQRHDTSELRTSSSASKSAAKHGPLNNMGRGLISDFARECTRSTALIRIA